MKNILFIIAFCCLSLATAYSQSGKLNLSAGIGFEPTTQMDNATTNKLPMSFKVGYQVSPMFSLNAFGAYSSITSQPIPINDGMAIRTTTNQTFLGLRGELKKGLGERFEVYGGGTLGYVFQDIGEMTAAGSKFSRVSGEPTPNDPNASKGQMLYAGFVGSTFFVQRHIGVFAELGYGVSLLNVGVTVRI